MATIGGARSLGMSRQIGSLEKGKKADLAILNLNKVHAIPADDIYAQIVYSARSTDVLHVMTDGQWRVFDQKLQIYEENEVIEQSWHYIYQLLDEIKSSET
jgi:cytosine/adenosine deaminase-related metal-dependent hydrolase